MSSRKNKIYIRRFLSGDSQVTARSPFSWNMLEESTVLEWRSHGNSWLDGWHKETPHTALPGWQQTFDILLLKEKRRRESANDPESVPCWKDITILYHLERQVNWKNVIPKDNGKSSLLVTFINSRLTTYGTAFQRKHNIMILSSVIR